MFTSDNAAEMNARRKTRKGGKMGSAVAHLPPGSGGDISSILADLRYWDGVNKVQSDDECYMRIQEFFEHAEDTGNLPTIENLAIALGVSRTTLFNWANGDLGEERAEMIQLAKERIHAVEGNLVMRGKIPAVPYIFRSKNYFGMVDKQEVHVEAEVEEEVTETIDKASLAELYVKSVPSIAKNVENAIEQKNGGE